MRISEFGAIITSWYVANKRDLPWRNTADPYVIWISEIILQQTRVDQGMQYFHKFLDAFPLVTDMAAASEDEILKMWQGLGYYSRARNLHATAKLISETHKGIFPSDYQEIIKLKGIGEYTAAAIASFAFNKPHAVVDGNVYRLLSRYFGIDTPIDTGPGKKQFAELAGELLDQKYPATYNQAIMEFGALQCRPANPLCPSCPLKFSCFAFENNKQNELPVKSKKLKPADRFFNYFDIRNDKHILLNQRKGKDIWQGLHDFPLIETSSSMNVTDLMQLPAWQLLFQNQPLKVKSVSREYKHKLSHQTIHSTFFEIEMDNLEKTTGDFLVVPRNSLRTYAIPRLIDIYLSDKDAEYR